MSVMSTGMAGLPALAGVSAGVVCWLLFGVSGVRRRRIMILGMPVGRAPARIGVAAVLSSVGAFVRNGGTVVAAFEELAGRRYPVPAVDERRIWEVLESRRGEHEHASRAYRVAGEVAMACRMSGMLGCEMARCLDAAAASYKRAVLAEDLRAKALAMPRSTVRLLSALPILTLMLGEALGAAPVAFLFGSLPGLACLFSGLACYSIGLVWMGALMRRVRDSRVAMAFGPLGDGRRQGGHRKGGGKSWESGGPRWRPR